MPCEGDFYFDCDAKKIASFECCKLNIWVYDHTSGQMLAPPTDNDIVFVLANVEVQRKHQNNNLLLCEMTNTMMTIKTMTVMTMIITII